jgi:hypothetical protein
MQAWGRVVMAGASSGKARGEPRGLVEPADDAGRKVMDGQNEKRTELEQPAAWREERREHGHALQRAGAHALQILQAFLR